MSRDFFLSVRYNHYFRQNVKFSLRNKNRLSQKRDVVRIFKYGKTEIRLPASSEISTVLIVLQQIYVKLSICLIEMYAINAYSGNEKNPHSLNLTRRLNTVTIR
jgi:hypothetical protein